MYYTAGFEIKIHLQIKNKVKKIVTEYEKINEGMHREKIIQILVVLHRNNLFYKERLFQMIRHRYIKKYKSLYIII